MLKDIFEGGYSEAVIDGAIGIGKSFISSVALAYMLYQLGCLKDPLTFYGMRDDMYLMNMSTNEQHARNVIFTYIKARIDESPWFLNRFPYNPKITSQLDFPNRIHLIPGNSSDTFFEGYNIFGGIIDEADAHDRTEEKDFAREGYNAIKQRIKSRFGDKGLLFVIGSPKTVDGFLLERVEEAKDEPKTFSAVVPYWECANPAVHKYSGETFPFRGLNVPVEHRDEFDRDPERALRDIAARPSLSLEPFFSMPERITENANYDRVWPTVQDSKGNDLKILPEFRPQMYVPYVVHVDLGVNKKGGDAAGFAMGHISGWDTYEGEPFPKITLDLIMRITAKPGGEIQISDMRKMIYDLVDRGFNIERVTYDGWQSYESIQQLNKRGIKADILSVDREMGPYESLKEAIYAKRLDYYPHPWLLDELPKLNLVNGKKVDHPPKGTKDVSDACAGVVFSLISNTPKSYMQKPRALLGNVRMTSKAPSLPDHLPGRL